MVQLSTVAVAAAANLQLCVEWARCGWKVDDKTSVGNTFVANRVAADKSNWLAEVLAVLFI